MLRRTMFACRVLEQRSDQHIKADGKPTPVTVYRIGGHLSPAFGEMYRIEAMPVATFNGTGTEGQRPTKPSKERIANFNGPIAANARRLANAA